MPTPAELLAACDRLLVPTLNDDDRDIGMVARALRALLEEGAKDTECPECKGIDPHDVLDGGGNPCAKCRLIIHCPECGNNHIDRDDWAIRIHRKHLCEVCGHLWRPFNYPTTGIAPVSEIEAQAAKLLRFNDSEAARIFERSNIEGMEEVIAAIDAARSGKEGK